MADKKPTENPTQNDVDRHLERADRLIAEHRGDRFDDPEEITSRQQVEEIARHVAEDAVRAHTPIPQVVFGVMNRPSSTPPSVKKRNTLFGAIGAVLGGLAAVLTALSQCSHDVRNDVKSIKPLVHEAK